MPNYSYLIPEKMLINKVSASQKLHFGACWKLGKNTKHMGAAIVFL